MPILDYVEVLSPFKDQILTEKETLKLTIEISDKNVPGSWFKDGKPIEMGDNVIIEVFIAFSDLKNIVL